MTASIAVTPAALMIAAVLAPMAPMAPAAPMPPAASSPHPRGAAGHDLPLPDEARMLDLVNRERTSRGLAPLRWNAVLGSLARAHAADMREAGRASHASRADGADFTRRLARTSIRARAAAENVGFDRDVDRAHRGLMASPGHRRNILDSGLTSIGIGIVSDGKGSIYVVQDFAAIMASLTDAEARAAVEEALRAAGAGPEERDLSRRMTAALESIIDRDDVSVADGLVEGPAWVMAYTSADPSVLPAEALRRVRDGTAFGLAASFRRTPSYPFGVYWVMLTLR